MQIATWHHPLDCNANFHAFLLIFHQDISSTSPLLPEMRFSLPLVLVFRDRTYFNAVNTFNIMLKSLVITLKFGGDKRVAF